MENIIKVFYVFVIIVFLIVIFRNYNFMKSTEILSDGSKVGKFRVYTEFENHEEAAKLLSDANQKIINILKYMKNKYKVNMVENSDMPLGPERQYVLNGILTRYNPEIITENNPRTSSETAFTISKGKELYVCLRRRESDNQLHSIDEVLFVMLHELTHMGCKEYGHSRHEFWRAFKFVLQEAVESGEYHPIDYEKNPYNYCGLRVYYNPYFDQTLKPLD